MFSHYIVMEIKKYFDIAKEDLSKNKDLYIIARKLFLDYPNYTASYYDQHDIEFEIKNKISIFFNIPFHCIHICGSSKTGKSFFKHTNFDKKNSDFDIAIISSSLYTKYLEIIFKYTDGFKIKTKFPRKKYNGKFIDGKEHFLQYINIGYFRPDLMPQCKEKDEWFRFFNQISEEYIQYFKNINAGIYLSQTFFEHKQFPSIYKSTEYIFEE